VVIGFVGEASFDEVRITTGDARDPAAFKTHRRVTALLLKTQEAKHRLGLVESRNAQSFKFEAPIEAERVTLEITGVSSGEGPDDAACLSDVVFLSKGKPLNGPFLSDKLRHERGRAQLMGTWYAGAEGARDRFLDFYFDGTFRYAFKPFDPEEKPVTIQGDYTFDGERLRLKLPAKGWVEEKTAPRAGAHGNRLLDLASKELKGTLAAAWSEAP
jgi:hypothetical protein